MNSPEEKAKELVDKFMDPECDSDYDDAYMCEHLAKSCALICVDEIIPCTWKKSTYEKQGYYWTDERTTTEYWQKVKEEIQKL